MAESGIAAQLPALRLKRNEDRRLHAGHLWIFSNEVDTQQTPLGRFEPGTLVRVLAHNDKALGLAYVNPKSLISARMLQSWTVPDTAWFVERLRIALALRERLYSQPYYRWIYGESDGLPGLVIDRYGNQCVVQIGTAGMESFKHLLQDAVLQVAECNAILFKNDGAARELEGLPSYVETGKGQFDAVGLVSEDGLHYSVPLTAGQKTGWYFDQAFNRRALPKYVRRGAKVLDVFSYVGAWGVRAAKSGGDVLCVDSSAAALELAGKNADNNRLKLATRKGDAFDVLEELAKEAARFDVVIIDPPAFAKHRKDLPKALAAYRRLNHLAMQVLAADGILVSCSCSFHVSADDLQETIAKAARATHKHLQIVEFGGQSPDHPVHPAIAETRYLKTYFCRVTDGLK